MKRQPKSSKHEAVIYVAYNPLTRKYERVYVEDQITATTTVIPMFWADDRYVTVPGTEVRGYVPSN